MISFVDMHELSITKNILEISLYHARTNNARHINDIYLVIGELTSFVDESIKFYWDFISKNTIAQDARLHIKRIDAKFRCRECLTEYQLRNNEFACPNCQSVDVDTIAGAEFYIEAIKIEN